MEKVGECMGRLGLADAPPLECLNGVVFIFINLAFSLLGAVAVIFLIFGAIKYITSRGDPKAVKSARDTITYAIIGMVLVIGTYVIANLFVNTFLPNSALFKFRIGP